MIRRTAALAGLALAALAVVEAATAHVTSRFQLADCAASWLMDGAPKADRDRAALADRALAELAVVLDVDASWPEIISAARGVVAHRDAACRGLQLAQAGLAAAAVRRPRPAKTRVEIVS